jgi:tetratricopeptide (TPR) repeat protein
LRSRRPGKLIGRRTRARASGSKAVVANNHANERIHAQYRALVASFEAGVLLFQKQNYDKARGVFEKLISAGPLEISSRARTYLRMCEQKLRPAEPQAKGPREHYELGIVYLNARQLDAALDCLTKAQKSGPDQDSVLYAMAVVYALQGNSSAAINHLSAAIERRPENRYLAAKDEDFASLASHPDFRRLVRTRSA